MILIKNIIFYRIITVLVLSNILFIIQGCAKNDSPIGLELSKSFDNPLIEKKIEKDKSEDKQKKLNKKPNKTKGKKIVKTQRTINRDNKIIPFTPHPYRITIRLSAANPSAPAETVTKALRNSGIRFEVEKIELLKDQFGESAKNSRRLKR
tara:strand:+ start:186 stop:638 length:453 start_codon:yes stop_codon:yes gene_type:complete